MGGSWGIVFLGDTGDHALSGGDGELGGSVDLANTWPSGRVARTLGISPNTLRNWDEKGLLRKLGLTVIKTPTGHRRFIPEEVQDLAERMRRGEVRLDKGTER